MGRSSCWFWIWIFVLLCFFMVDNWCYWYHAVFLFPPWILSFAIWLWDDTFVVGRFDELVLLELESFVLLLLLFSTESGWLVVKFGSLFIVHWWPYYWLLLHRCLFIVSALLSSLIVVSSILILNFSRIFFTWILNVSQLWINVYVWVV
jgi:hypothetical protein